MELYNSYYPRFAYLPTKIKNEWIWLKRYYEIRITYRTGYDLKKITEIDYFYLKLQGKHQITIDELWEDLFKEKE